MLAHGIRALLFHNNSASPTGPRVHSRLFAEQQSFGNTKATHAARMLFWHRIPFMNECGEALVHSRSILPRLWELARDLVENVTACVRTSGTSSWVSVFAL